MGFCYGIDHAYFICSEKYEPDRYRHIQKWCTANNIKDYSFVYMKHGSEISPEEAFKVYNPWVERPNVGEHKNFNRYNLKLSEISLCINFGTAALTAIKSGHKTVAIFESDAIFSDDFLQKFNACLRKLDGKEWDYLSIADGVGMKPKRDPSDTETGWFPILGNFHTRTTCGQVFKTDLLKNVMSSFFPFAEVLDWELNYQLTRYGSRSLWLDPCLVKNGSCSGEFATSL